MPRIEAVTLTDLARVGQEQHLDLARMIILAVGDHDRIASPLTALNLGEPLVLSPS